MKLLEISRGLRKINFFITLGTILYDSVEAAVIGATLYVLYKNNDRHVNLSSKFHPRAIFIAASENRCSFLIVPVIYANSTPPASGPRVLTSLCPDITHEKLVANWEKNERTFQVAHIFLSFRSPKSASFNPLSYYSLATF